MSTTIPNATPSAKERLTEDFKSVVVETEHLLHDAASIGGEKAADLKASLEQSIATAGQQLKQLQAAATARTLSAAHATDEYVHAHPWRSIGIAAGVSLAIGTVIGLSLQRR